MNKNNTSSDLTADTEIFSQLEAYTLRKFQINGMPPNFCLGARIISNLFYTTQKEEDFIEIKSIEGKVIESEIE